MELPPHARDWLRQWRDAGPALAAVRRRELRALTEADALAAAEALLSLPGTPIGRSRWERSGLVEQQERFRRLRA